MISLGWESLEHVRIKLEIEETQLRMNQSIAELGRAHRMQNAALFTRWHAEGQTCSERHRSLIPLLESQRDQLRLNDAMATARSELNDLRQADPQFVARKQTLELALLKAQQRCDDCTWAVHSADEPQLEEAFQEFNALREQCVGAIADFRRDYFVADTGKS